MIRQKILLIVFIAVLMALYFFGHNAEGSESREHLLGGFGMIGRIVVDLGAVVLLASIAGGIGRRSLGKIDFSGISLLERIAIESSIGLGLIMLLALLMGLLGFYNWLIWLVLAVIAVLVSPSIFRWWKDFRDALKISQDEAKPWTRFINAFVLLMLFLALLIALAPAWAWDGMAYHLVIPQRYLEDGAIRQHLDIHFFGFPQGMEMLYGLLMMLTGENRAPAVLHFYLGVLGLLAIFGFMRRNASTKAAYTSLLLLLASYNLWKLFTWSYVDLALVLFGAVAIIALIEWRKNLAWQFLAVAALAGGFAAGIKYTVFPLLLAIYLIVLISDWRKALRNTLIFGGFGLLVFLPWMAKGLVLYENPIFPYVFESENWDATRAENFNETGKGLMSGDLLYQIQIPLLPFAATIFGLDNVTPYRFSTGVFLLTLPFALLIGWKELPEEARKLARMLVFMALVVLAFWMLIASFSGIGGQTRLMIVGAPLLAILGGLAYHSIEHWKRRPIDMLFILQGALLISVLLGIFDHLSYFAKSRVLEYQLGVIDEDTYLENNLKLYYSAMQALEDLPPDSIVQFLWEPKTYYCPEHLSCYADLLFDEWARAIEMGLSPEERIMAWRDEGVDYFLFHIEPEGYEFWLNYHTFARERNALFPEYFYPEVEEIWTDGNSYTLYRWREN